MLEPLDEETLPVAVRRIRLISAGYYRHDQHFASGDRLQVRLRVKPPTGLSNPGSADRERWYLSRGIDARGTVTAVVSRLPSASGWSSGRADLSSFLAGTFRPETAATLQALLTGNRSGVSESQWQWLRVTGTAHLFVVSGLHVAVAGAFGWWLGRGMMLLPALVGLSMARWHWVPSIVALLVAASYAGLSGWGIPVQRAWLMLAVFMAGNLWLQPISGWQRWRLALVAVLTLQPLAILETGTWLSFGAVALILWYVQQRTVSSVKTALSSWLGIQWVLFIGMLPLMASGFNQLSLLSIPVNLLLVPLVSIAIWVLPVLLALASMGGNIGFLAIALVEAGTSLVWSFLAWSAEVPGLHVPVSAPEGWALLCVALGVSGLLLPMPVPYRLLALPLLLPVLSPASLPPAGHFRAHLFDVGQGQALLVETAEGALLYDTGPGYGGGGAAFGYTVQPWLERRGIDRLKTLIISHADSDHSGGESFLRVRMKVENFYAGEPEHHVGATRCKAQYWQSGSVRFRFLPAFAQDADVSANNRSCVLEIETDQCRLLVTGDLDVSGEYRLLSAGYRHKPTWLIAGHHGSRDSTSSALLELLAPEQVLISAGRFNRFGHPHEEVIDRLAVHHIPWKTTSHSGALEMVADSKQCLLRSYREQQKRYWTAG
ncbi:DNA internalization-related competence protein ComEC/Rec2 [Marinobacterium sp. A346]|uniref:DNA internalization-related competence protein ComEC/Rec2 n=2 Tax=Marinobacterium weihaiense TaxID=2851016 RepID=A0ABS6M799_9GAMM|nr:DNA internalization-related competence protein ComEC/Rec2 [Marinobacterium weihaiense]